MVNSDMEWPSKEDSQDYQIDFFIELYSGLNPTRQFTIIKKGDKPDYILEDNLSHLQLGVEVTAVYVNDKSVPKLHISDSECTRIPFDQQEIDAYQLRVLQKIQEKINKAKHGYDLTNPLILAIYSNEYCSIYISYYDWITFFEKHRDIIESKEPFKEIALFPIQNNKILILR
jgi:hypothetical protein